MTVTPGEAALRREVDRLTALLAAKDAELEAIARRATSLQSITTALAGALSVEAVASVVAAHGPGLFGATATLVFLLEGERVRLVSFGGVGSERVASYRELPLSAPLPMTAMLRDGQPRWLDRREDLLAAHPEAAETRLDGKLLQGAVILPLKEGERTIGGLAFSFYEPHHFGAVEREFFLTVASQCGQAIARAHLFDAEHRARARLQAQQKTLETMLDASAALAATLDSREALEELAQLAVPGIADWCAIDELAPDGQIRRIAVQHTDPNKVVLAHETARRWPPDPDAPTGVPHVLRTGVAEWAENMPAAVIDGIPDPELRTIVRELGLRSYAIVPMIARGRTLGALSLVHAESGRSFGESDIHFAEDLARRAAMALDNARLYESAEAARRHLHNLFMQAPAAICILRGPDHVFELANPPYIELVGRRPLLGLPLRAALPELADQGMVDLFDHVYATGETFSAREMAVQLARGPGGPLELRRFDLVYQATRGGLGVIDGIAVFVFEVTHQVRAREQAEALAAEVARSEARMRNLVAATAAIVWTATATGETLEVSPSWLAFTGQTPEQYANGGFVAAIHPDDRERTMAAWQAAVAAGAPYTAQYRLLRSNGEYAHTVAHGMPVIDATGVIAEYIGCNVDITDLRQAEAVARGHAETLQTLNELGRLLSAELDLDKLVQGVTDAATALTGAQFGALFYNEPDPGQPRYSLYALSGAPREAFSRFPQPRATAIFYPTFAGERVIRSDDITADPAYGKHAPWHGMPPGHLPVRSYLAVPVRSRSGEVLGGIFLGHGAPGMFDDRAEALAVGLAAQAAVAMDNANLFGQAQRLIGALELTNRELDQFAYVTSHDLKAPLRGIASLAEWLEEDLAPHLDADARKKLGLMRGRVRRMEGLIQGILDYSRAGRAGGKRERVDVRRLVGEIAELLAPAPPAAIVADAGLPTLITERVALEQVLMNLIGNALKHAGRPDPVVRVEVAETDAHSERHEFRVIDNGPGVAPEFRDRIWVIFQTLHARDQVESTGIGLAIVKKIVETRGGRVWVDSAPGGGASFGFTWPKRDERRA